MRTLPRRVIAWIRADWGVVDYPPSVGIAAILLTVTCGILLADGAPLGLVILPFAGLAWYRTIRAIRHRGDSRQLR